MGVGNYDQGILEGTVPGAHTGSGIVTRKVIITVFRLFKELEMWEILKRLKSSRY